MPSTITETEKSELETFKGELHAKLVELQKQHGWCEEFDSVLRKLDLPKMPKKQRFHFEVDVLSDKRTAIYSGVGYTEDEVRAEITPQIDEDRRRNRLYYGSISNSSTVLTLGDEVRLRAG